MPLPAVALRRSREAYDVVDFPLLPEPRTDEFRGQQKAKRFDETKGDAEMVGEHGPGGVAVSSLPGRNSQLGRPIQQQQQQP